MKILKEMITSEHGTIGFTCIIVDSIKDHIIPHVSSLNTPKEMFDSLTKLFEGKNINKKMTLQNQLKNVKIQNAETI